MLNIPQLLANELTLSVHHVENVLQLFKEEATVPFVARYRKERTGSMNEVTLYALLDRFTSLQELEQRKQTILKTIESQGRLTDDLKSKIEQCLKRTDLEDLYLPYKPKKRTRATLAKERGLEPLAQFVKGLNAPETTAAGLEEEAARYLNPEKGVVTAADALVGAADILAEEVAEKAEYRAFLRGIFLKEGYFESRIRDEHAPGTTKFEMYRNYKVRVRDIAPHNMLALRRGEKENILTFDLSFDEATVLGYLEQQEIRTKAESIVSFYRAMLKDAFERLMKPTLVTDIRVQKKAEADQVSISTFEANIRELLLSSPAGMRPTIGIDPGLRTGCKVAVVDATGTFVEHDTIFPFENEEQKGKAVELLLHLIAKHNIELIAIGNGTAGRETYEFVGGVLSQAERKPIRVMVSEAGASVYSASKVAREEFPRLDLTVRGAISIARRLQDPLAELVKVDPKSIGVGQYQHDVNQKLLKDKLHETVESCVNHVGVDLNTASAELLSYVSGINRTTSKNIIAYRKDRGAFKGRQELLGVPAFGPKTFEQAAGFLRIRNGESPLDNTAVHPESYGVAEAIVRDLGVPLEEIPKSPEKVRGLDLKQYMTDTVGEPTLRDILEELQRPGRDPRAEFKYATFHDAVKDLKDLKRGMELEGVVTNVTNFGAFVDVGVHQDGLVHVSQLANRYVNDPTKVVKVGQVVKVRVLDVNENLKRISLSMKAEGGEKQRPPRRGKGPRRPEKGTPGKEQHQPREKPKEPESKYTIDDLKAKFNSR